MMLQSASQHLALAYSPFSLDLLGLSTPSPLAGNPPGPRDSALAKMLDLPATILRCFIIRLLSEGGSLCTHLSGILHPLTLESWVVGTVALTETSILVKSLTLEANAPSATHTCAPHQPSASPGFPPSLFLLQAFFFLCTHFLRGLVSLAFFCGLLPPSATLQAVRLQLPQGFVVYFSCTVSLPWLLGVRSPRASNPAIVLSGLQLCHENLEPLGLLSTPSSIQVFTPCAQGSFSRPHWEVYLSALTLVLSADRQHSALLAALAALVGALGGGGGGAALPAASPAPPPCTLHATKITLALTLDRVCKPHHHAEHHRWALSLEALILSLRGGKQAWEAGVGRARAVLWAPLQDVAAPALFPHTLLLSQGIRLSGGAEGVRGGLEAADARGSDLLRIFCESLTLDCGAGQAEGAWIAAVEKARGALAAFQGTAGPKVGLLVERGKAVGAVEGGCEVAVHLQGLSLLTNKEAGEYCASLASLVVSVEVEGEEQGGRESGDIVEIAGPAGLVLRLATEGYSLELGQVSVALYSLPFLRGVCKGVSHWHALACACWSGASAAPLPLHTLSLAVLRVHACLSPTAPCTVVQAQLETLTLTFSPACIAAVSCSQGQVALQALCPSHTAAVGAGVEAPCAVRVICGTLRGEASTHPTSFSLQLSLLEGCLLATPLQPPPLQAFKLCSLSSLHALGDFSSSGSSSSSSGGGGSSVLPYALSLSIGKLMALHRPEDAVRLLHVYCAAPALYAAALDALFEALAWAPQGWGEGAGESQPTPRSAASLREDYFLHTVHSWGPGCFGGGATSTSATTAVSTTTTGPPSPPPDFVFVAAQEPPPPNPASARNALASTVSTALHHKGSLHTLSLSICIADLLGGLSMPERGEAIVSVSTITARAALTLPHAVARPPCSGSAAAGTSSPGEGYRGGGYRGGEEESVGILWKSLSIEVQAMEVREKTLTPPIPPAHPPHSAAQSAMGGGGGRCGVGNSTLLSLPSLGFLWEERREAMRTAGGWRVGGGSKQWICSGSDAYSDEAVCKIEALGLLRVHLRGGALEFLLQCILNPLAAMVAAACPPEQPPPHAHQDSPYKCSAAVLTEVVISSIHCLLTCSPEGVSIPADALLPLTGRGVGRGGGLLSFFFPAAALPASGAPTSTCVGGAGAAEAAVASAATTTSPCLTPLSTASRSTRSTSNSTPQWAPPPYPPPTAPGSASPSGIHFSLPTLRDTPLTLSGMHLTYPGTLWGALQGALQHHLATLTSAHSSAGRSLALAALQASMPSPHLLSSSHDIQRQPPECTPRGGGGSDVLCAVLKGVSTMIPLLLPPPLGIVTAGLSAAVAEYSSSSSHRGGGGRQAVSMGDLSSYWPSPTLAAVNGRVGVEPPSLRLTPPPSAHQDTLASWEKIDM